MDIRLIVDRIPAFTWSAHADGSIEFVNQRWREYAGLSPEESQGWGWQVAIHPEDLTSFMREWRELLNPGNQVKSKYACAAMMGSFVGSSFASNLSATKTGRSSCGMGQALISKPLSKRKGSFGRMNASFGKSRTQYLRR
jgi:hypothetical protein